MKATRSGPFYYREHIALMPRTCGIVLLRPGAQGWSKVNETIDSRTNLHCGPNYVMNDNVKVPANRNSQSRCGSSQTIVGRNSRTGTRTRNGRSNKGDRWRNRSHNDSETAAAMTTGLANLLGRRATPITGRPQGLPHKATRQQRHWSRRARQRGSAIVQELSCHAVR
jgi:hypothetical protein